MKENPVVVLVIVLVLAAYGLWLMKNPAVPPTLDEKGMITGPDIKINTPVLKTSYEQALEIYKDYRIQFGENCRATPSNVSYKNGTNIMLDNRSAYNRAIRVGSVYTVNSYDFKIVKLSSASLPATWFVDCDNFQNVATILLQK